MTRRQMLAFAAAVPGISPALRAQNGRFRTSLAEWSLHKSIRSQMMTNLEFPQIAKEQFGISGIEFVNTLWEAPTQYYLGRLKANMKKFGVEGVLIMCDGEGSMGHSEQKERLKAADLHRKWVDYAAELGCHAIRMNMYAEKEAKTEAEIGEFLKCCQESFTRICEYARQNGISVAIENHGGLSSNPDILTRLMKMVNLPNFGTLPDFGNFPKGVDKHEAVSKLMPYAKAVSFKCFEFGADGKETTIDMDRMMQIVAKAGYGEGGKPNWIGIEYEGTRMTEFMGVQAAKRFLDRYSV
ncbi:MAG: sugar phosphate isomerase/epimerase [Acidobacteria bacterium]|nr:sugar phosphate isomerase/epimerase [Acidobacteriota bacterium]